MRDGLSFKAAVERALPEPADAEAVYGKIFEAFEMLPLAAVVAEQVLVLHGGIGDGSWGLEDLKHRVPRPLRDEYDKGESRRFAAP